MNFVPKTSPLYACSRLRDGQSRTPPPPSLPSGAYPRVETASSLSLPLSLPPFCSCFTFSLFQKKHRRTGGREEGILAGAVRSQEEGEREGGKKPLLFHDDDGVGRRKKERRHCATPREKKKEKEISFHPSLSLPRTPKEEEEGVSCFFAPLRSILEEIGRRRKEEGPPPQPPLSQERGEGEGPPCFFFSFFPFLPFPSSHERGVKVGRRGRRRKREKLKIPTFSF